MDFLLTGKGATCFSFIMITSVMIRLFVSPFTTNGDITRNCANSLIFFTLQKRLGTASFNEVLLDDGITHLNQNFCR